jgi:hypothetical protein
VVYQAGNHFGLEHPGLGFHDGLNDHHTGRNDHVTRMNTEAKLPKPGG